MIRCFPLRHFRMIRCFPLGELCFQFSNLREKIPHLEPISFGLCRLREKLVHLEPIRLGLCQLLGTCGFGNRFGLKSPRQQAFNSAQLIDFFPEQGRNIRPFCFRIYADSSVVDKRISQFTILLHDRIVVQSAEQEERLTLSLAAVTKFLQGRRSCHIAHCRTVKHHAKSEFRKAVCQFHILATEAEPAIKDAAFGKERSLTRRSPSPEVGKIEHLPVPQIAVGKKETPGFRDVAH